MSRIVAVLCFVVGTLAITPALRADIIGFSTYTPPTTPNLSAGYGSTTLAISGDDSGSGGVVNGQFISSGGTDDPSIDIENIVYNHSGSTWTSYLATIEMSQDFSIVGPPMVYTPSDWTTVVTQPTPDPLNPGDYIGSLQLNAGTPVQSLPDREPADKLDFGYTLSFGNGSPTFTQTLSSVPEPSTIVLLFVLSAGGAFGAYRRRFWRRVSAV